MPAALYRKRTHSVSRVCESSKYSAQWERPLSRMQDIKILSAAIERLLAVPAAAVRIEFGSGDMRLFSTLQGRSIVAEIYGNEDTDEAASLAKLGFMAVYDEPWYRSQESVTNKAWFDDPDPVRLAKVCRLALRIVNWDDADPVEVTDEVIPELDSLQEFLVRQRAASWYHDEDSVVPEPYVIFCAYFDPYRGFVHEADTILAALSYLVKGGLPGELARDAFRPYQNFWSDLYDDGWQQAYPRGFPFDFYISGEDMELNLPVSAGFWWEAANAGIPGAGYGRGSSASGEFLVVDDEESLEELRRHFQGEYLIVELDEDDFAYGAHRIPEEYIDAVRRTGATRIENGVLQPVPDIDGNSG